MTVATYIRVADECWIALASLHRAYPDRSSFSASEILDRVKVEKVLPELRAGVQAHIYLHNVANLPPNSATYRMFFRTGDGNYRLYKPSDESHPKRRGKTCPERERLPAEYQPLRGLVPARLLRVQCPPASGRRLCPSNEGDWSGDLVRRE